MLPLQLVSVVDCISCEAPAFPLRPHLCVSPRRHLSPLSSALPVASAMPEPSALFVPSAMPVCSALPQLRRTRLLVDKAPHLVRKQEGAA